MSDSKPRSFWGRVTEFVKNPTQDWSLTRHENALREQQAQEEVKAKEEQRKLDAFVRRRELDSLRRLRRRQAEGLPLEVGPSDIPDTGTGPAQAPAEREATLRKINEIERAMTDDTRAARRDAAPTSAAAGDTAASAGATLATGDTVRLGGLAEGATIPPAATIPATEPLVFPVTDMATRPHGGAHTVVESRSDAGETQLAATQLGGPTQMAPTVINDSPLLAPAQRTVETWIKTGGGAYGMSPMAVDVQEGVSSSPLFDQACIDFANGNDAAAERALLDAISGSPERDLENEFWLALFDLYRASNDPVKFEALVVDYVDRFQSSAPSWTIQPRAGDAPARPAPPAGAGDHFAALGELDAAQSRALLLLARSGARRMHLDFNAMTSIANGSQTFAVEALKAINAAAACEVEIAGLPQLLDACAHAAPPMQRDADPAWWSLRLEALRLAGSQEAFDAAALDFCVTYEISPPAWEPSRAKVTLVHADAADTEPGTQLPTQAQLSSNSLFGHTAMGLAAAELRGEISGGSEDFLKPLDKAIERHQGLIVNLIGLRRLDFASAAVMLNWVMAQTGGGRSVQFEGTHRLIAGLFVILGINSVAEIHLRKS